MKTLTQETMEALKNDKRPIKELAELTGIQVTRLYRIKSQGFELKARELETLMSFYGINDRQEKAQLEAEEIKAQALEEAKMIKLNAYALGIQLAMDDIEQAVADRYRIPKELLQWRLADPKLKELKLA